MSSLYSRVKKRPLTPGRRHQVQRELNPREAGIQWLPAPLVRGEKRSGGRNQTGRITVRGVGGGHQVRLREVTPMPSGDEASGVVVRGIQWDPRRTAPVALVSSRDIGEMRRVLAGEGMTVGECIHSPRRVFTSSLPSSLSPSPGGGEGEGESRSSFRGQRDREILPNTRCRRGWLPVGSSFYDRTRPTGASLVKTAGSSGLLMNPKLSTTRREASVWALGHSGAVGRSRVRLPSGEERRVPEDAWVTLGRVGGQDHGLQVIGKAGLRRLKGIRPTVRGCAMNPIDHPHGGRTKGGRHDVTPWARIAKGQPTRRTVDLPSHRRAFLVKRKERKG